MFSFHNQPCDFYPLLQIPDYLFCQGKESAGWWRQDTVVAVAMDLMIGESNQIHKVPKDSLKNLGKSFSICCMQLYYFLLLHFVNIKVFALKYNYVNYLEYFGFPVDNLHWMTRKRYFWLLIVHTTFSCGNFFPVSPSLSPSLSIIYISLSLSLPLSHTLIPSPSPPHPFSSFSSV